MLCYTVCSAALLGFGYFFSVISNKFQQVLFLIFICGKSTVVGLDQSDSPFTAVVDNFHLFDSILHLLENDILIPH